MKERVRSAQHAALKAVNTELVGLYWDIGRVIAERQKEAGWGKAVVENLSVDLQREPERALIARIEGSPEQWGAGVPSPKNL